MLFENGCRGGDILEGGTYAEGLRPTTLQNTIKGYGRFLCVLQQRDPGSLALSPAERVTPSCMRLYLQTLLEQGNTNNTILARIMELRSALRVMYPEREFVWLTKPGGASIRKLLPVSRNLVPLFDVAELSRWGHDLMDKGLCIPASRRAELFRNGLLIAMLADRAPRQRSLAQLRVGHGIRRNGSDYTLAFSAAETKSKRRLEYGLHPSLTPRIEHYLNVERPRLLAGQVHDWFWVNRQGNRLAAIGIDGVIRRASKARFGLSYGTHSFRYALATAGMIANPSTPELVAAVLGNSPAVAEKYYVLGGQVEAARSLHATLAHFGRSD